ncbi:MAG: Arginine-tRNA ligase [Candidatus Nomurabacteria bacterium GW2011_GWC2_41_8]|uniref:Arginine--tRNA ligase n=3 Tax=Candidatus Nomuraibacteriota TaxID=1752729 RepID=A0A1F6YAH7_9BACT|nr:MAG: Arginine-tRNA ligase [Candidatus Nomurabacteria bacterium GW2011_GWA2_41_25]KKS24653.1 MAG: Arginine-tRNA ligase [Candidatus Nomurabacteria bacterium GW2011_GWC2_41_8]OGI80953.1 MAG: arginine--tRNA ligase [Candidatus Nomurabacteria bacterium RIFCSPHIGHO2_02_FULL_41_52]OGI84524.1 MAG: arginine--tRNA ligase [Candidatus Nomurabacteria bacterium RIFCSPHIGHO2_12_FULL_42_19]OGI99964.1 MAG: arginine--tRNA ligase [Candidatus Nomurabacteria bacterium RIFCSPLOWO2_02_FULL_42_24]OGJ03366.1 MAG: ar
MIEEKIKKLIKEALKNLNIESGNFSVEHPADLTMGDYSTNVAKLANVKKLETKNKRFTREEVADMIGGFINRNKPKEIEKVEEKAGFINFYLSRKFFAGSIEEIVNKANNVGKNDILSGKKIMVEYTDPNPFKPFHIGHLMTNAIGESIARILEHSGAAVARANYQGDIGLHVAKAIWGLLKNEKLQNKSGSHNLQATNIGQAYMHGAEAYENDEDSKKEIEEINKKIYARNDKKINEIYQWGFDVTMEAFEDLYKMLGTKFDFYFLESAMADIGRDIVNANMDKVFEESDGATVFKAEKHDPKLHTRVFITSAGLPTYETKELGLTEEKFKTNPEMDLSIMITANEQMNYMRVVAKAISLIHPDFEKRMKHITHGMMRFVGDKMSSRKGNVITGESLLNDARDAILEKMTDREFPNEEREKIASDVGVAAIKYSILKQSTGGDIIYDFENSISFEGDSGPYLQYSCARANSVLEKAQKENILPDFEVLPGEIFEVEKLLYRFPEIVFRSASEYEPHFIANYLIEVARAYNSFYGNTVIVNKEDKTSPYKIALTYAFSFVMKTGLHLLGIEAPVKM